MPVYLLINNQVELRDGTKLIEMQPDFCTCRTHGTLLPQGGLFCVQPGPLPPPSYGHNKCTVEVPWQVLSGNGSFRLPVGLAHSQLLVGGPAYLLGKKTKAQCG